MQCHQPVGDSLLYFPDWQVVTRQSHITATIYFALNGIVIIKLNIMLHLEKIQSSNSDVKLIRNYFSVVINHGGNGIIFLETVQCDLDG